MRWALAFFGFIAATILISVAQAAGIMTFVSDLISTSAPSAPATHTVQFTVVQNVPPSGKIVITPEAGQFSIPASFDYTDVDLAVSSGGPYIDRSVAAVADAANDGATVVTGSYGSITIELNSTTGINAGEQVQVRLGTNATVDATGTDNIENPVTVQSYMIDIRTKDASDVEIDFGRTMIAVVAPVGLSFTAPNNAPIRFNGLPSGIVAAGNPVIELSLETNIPATCRYATSTDVLYTDMTADFNSASFGRVFWVNTTGYQNEMTYNFYVRCRSLSGVSNTDDYLISFTTKPTPISNTSIESEGLVSDGPQGYLGSGGVGFYPNGSGVLFLATVKLSGFTVPGGVVTVLKDGTKLGTTNAKSDGKFEATVTGLERGSYGFQMYTKDSRELLSSLYGTTLSVAQGTTNEITNITLPPTIKLSTESAAAGDVVEALGGASPNSAIEVRVVGISSGASASKVHTYNATSTSDGSWKSLIDTKSFSKGMYAVQARALRTSQSKSGYSRQINLNIGTSSSGSCGKPDMNGDEKVNLVDFSIFLLSWGTTAAEADFNCDKQVNLGDFSIMLFNWTG